MVARLTYWYLRHPMWGRPLALLLLLYWLGVMVTALAPPAFASSNAEALNWTGIKDDQGVPLGSYYLATIDIYQAAKDSAPDVSWNPGTWGEWLVSMGSSMGGGALASVLLTAESGLFIGLLTISVWVFRLAANSIWLTFFATLARPFVDAIFIVIAKAGLLLWLLPIAVFAGGWVIVVKGAGARGWMMILSAFLVAILGIAFVSDPVALMYGDHGLLAIARGAAFQVAEAAVHNGPSNTRPLDGASPLDVFTGDLITAVARKPFQVWQYGHVLDGACDAAWTSTMISHPSEDAPIRAMEDCGNFAGAQHASNLNGNNVWLGALLFCAAFLFAYFMLVAAGALVRVPAQALYRVIKAPVDVKIGILDGAGRDYMWFAARQFFGMALEMFVYTLFICIAGMAIGRVMTGTLPPELGGSSPVAKILMFAASACVATGLFRLVQTDLFGQQARGPFGRLAWGVAGAAASVVGAKGVSSAIKALGAARGGKGGSPPWEELESKVGDIAEKLGATKQGFDTISSPKSGAGGGGSDDGAGRTVSNGGGDGSGGDSAGAPSSRRPVPTPTSLTRPANRRDGAPAPRGGGQGKAGRGQSVAGGRQSRRPVPTTSPSGRPDERQRGFDTIAPQQGSAAPSPDAQGPARSGDPGAGRGLDTISPNPTNRRDS
ncbi:hypothetical protein [Mycolicibacterium mageritense]|uniref:hypothetical protein n=1 Tax=Mycolicibacterium mageritense TaxID=53462 RepID=UPI0011D6ED87|nr:hypothetical protein [Mycolicibacterium mageritense]TXI56457.1 MAG: hypothetical protein E6Q55_28745 [Mycolicibacterium mageritense]